MDEVGLGRRAGVYEEGKESILGRGWQGWKCGVEQFILFGEYQNDRYLERGICAGTWG